MGGEESEIDTGGGVRAIFLNLDNVSSAVASDLYNIAFTVLGTSDRNDAGAAH